MIAGISPQDSISVSIFKKNGIKSIIDDRKRVGDHCISSFPVRYGTRSHHICYKVYNKFVQMLESAAVRESLGSRIDALVVKEGRFAKKLRLTQRPWIYPS